jgi:hypothetical protein
MDYVEWVDRVMGGMLGAWEAADANNRNVMGVSFQDVGAALGFDAEEMEFHDHDRPATAILQALFDLKALGLVEQQSYPRFFKFTHEGWEVSNEGLSALWGPMVKQYLRSDQLEVLTKLAEMCPEDYGTHVVLRERLLTDIGAELGDRWADEQGTAVYRVVQELKGIGLAKMGGGIGALNAIPTYRGLVRVTRQMDTELQALIRSLLPDWETTNVDFKREVNLKNKEEKGELVKDLLALVNTKSSGRCFLVIGFHPKTHEFFKSVDPGITQDRIEDILNAYAEPVPSIRYNRVGWESGTVGIIEIIREPHKLPYTIKEDITNKIKAGDVYVRHGSHTDKLQPGEREYQDLIDEGNRARQ